VLSRRGLSVVPAKAWLGFPRESIRREYLILLPESVSAILP
jgi:hypothetical protein